MSSELIWAFGYGALGALCLIKSWSYYYNHKMMKKYNENGGKLKNIERKREGEEAEQLIAFQMPDDDEDFKGIVISGSGSEEDPVKFEFKGIPSKPQNQREPFTRRCEEDCRDCDENLLVGTDGKEYRLVGKNYILHRGETQFHPSAFEEDSQGSEDSYLKYVERETFADRLVKYEKGMTREKAYELYDETIKELEAEEGEESDKSSSEPDDHISLGSQDTQEGEEEEDIPTLSDVEFIVSDSDGSEEEDYQDVSPSQSPSPSIGGGSSNGRILEDDQVHGESPRLLAVVQQLDVRPESEVDSSQEHSDSPLSDADLQAVHRESDCDSGRVQDQPFHRESRETCDDGGSSEVPTDEDSVRAHSQTEIELVRDDEEGVLQRCSPTLGGGASEAKRSINSRRGKKTRRGKAGGRS